MNLSDRDYIVERVLLYVFMHGGTLRSARIILQEAVPGFIPRLMTRQGWRYGDFLVRLDPVRRRRGLASDLAGRVLTDRDALDRV